MCLNKSCKHVKSSGCESMGLTKSIQGNADKFLAQQGRKQATATEGFDVHIFYLLSDLDEY